LTELKDYRDLAADWYQDSATVFDEMIRPRIPAKTIEELQRQLDEVKNKSENLASTVNSLNDMDRELRKRYKVTPSVDSNRLQKFAKANAI
jgi:hypothetical protein